MNLKINISTYLQVINETKLNANFPSKLPKGWVWTTVGDLYDIIGGGTPSTNVVEYWNGGIPWITSADIYGLKDIRPRKQITKKAIVNSATNLVPEGSIIVVTRVGLGKVALTKTPICFSQDSQALVRCNSLLLSDYSLYYLAQAVQIFKHVYRGTTIAGVTKKQLAELEFPLPPLSEQHRIVAKIEELFTRLDAGVEALKKVKFELKRYRQAVLKYAFEGKLTGGWRGNVGAHGNAPIEPASVLLEKIKEERENNAKIKLVGAVREPPLQKDLPELPEGWTWVRLKEILLPSKEKINPNKTDPLPYVGLEHIKKDTGRLLGHGFSDSVRSTKNRFYSGDLLYGKLRPYLNKACVPDFDGVCSTDILVFPESTCLFNRYILYRILCDEFVRYANQRVSGVQHPRVDFEKISEFPILLPPLPEQHQIVEEIERRFSVADEIEKTVGACLQQAQRLRQSILKKAFEGKLVPQYPNDEPAEKLLERIKAEKTKLDYNKKLRGKTKKVYRGTY